MMGLYRMALSMTRRRRKLTNWIRRVKLSWITGVVSRNHDLFGRPISMLLWDDLSVGISRADSRELRV